MARKKHKKHIAQKRKTYGKKPKKKMKNKAPSSHGGGYKPYKGADSDPFYYEDMELYDNDFQIAEAMD